MITSTTVSESRPVFAFPCLSLKQIYAHYRALLMRWYRGRGLVLKTDLHNEIMGGFRSLDECGLDPLRTVYLEFDRLTCERVKRAKPELRIVRGDIRRLPFASDTFQAVVDLSTIDHVLPSETAGVIAGYHRVLVPWGLLLLVAWCRQVVDRSVRGWKPSGQYFVSWPELPGDLAAFVIVRLAIFHKKGRNFLAEVVALAKKEA